MSIDKIAKVIRIYKELYPIARQLHHQDENSCNYGLTKRQETRVENLEVKAEALARQLGLHAYHQGDPRGGTLYLIKRIKDDHAGNYTNGVYIW